MRNCKFPSSLISEVLDWQDLCIKQVDYGISTTLGDEVCLTAKNENGHARTRNTQYSSL
jgi:hypothetical protein